MRAAATSAASASRRCLAASSCWDRSRASRSSASAAGNSPRNVGFALAGDIDAAADLAELGPEAFGLDAQRPQVGLVGLLSGELALPVAVEIAAP